MTQAQFADAAGIGFRTVCRYEAGDRDPALKALAHLAALANEKQLPYLHSYFEGLRQTKIANRMTTRPSDDTCRISRLELSRWSKIQLDCFWLMESVLGRLPSSPERELLRECAGMVSDVGAQMAPYLTTTDYGKLFSSEMRKRVGPDGKLDLTGIVLGPNAKVSPDGRSIRLSMRDKLKGVKAGSKKKGK